MKLPIIALALATALALIVFCFGCGKAADQATVNMIPTTGGTAVPEVSPTPLYIHLDVEGIDVGSTIEDVTRQLGNPRSFEKKGENPCGGPKLIYRYNGLDITFDPDANEKSFSVVRI